MSYTITAPDKRVDGLQNFGPVTLQFRKGVAETDELSEGLAAYLHSSGFTVEDDDAPKAYDPASANVADVQAYLASADDEERARVIAAEADGKARKSITEWAPAPAADEGDGDGELI